MTVPTTDLWYLPPRVPTPALTDDGGARRLASIEPTVVQAAVRALDASAPALAALSVEAIITAIDAALTCWRDPADAGRRALLTHCLLYTSPSPRDS